MIPAPRVLVLVATYNGASHIDEQIASILWQLGAETHLLVRDDGSTDGTIDACTAWKESHGERVSVLSDDVRTGSATGNFFRLLTAAPLAEYDYVALADQDDIWFPTKLRRAIDAMQAAGADGYSSDMLAFDEGARATWLIGKAGAEAELDYLFQGASAGCTYVLSSAAAQRVRDVMAAQPSPSPRALSHDWTIYAACRSRGLRWVRDARTAIVYRQHSGNNYGARTGLAAFLSRLQGVRDEWYRNHVDWLQNIVVMNDAEREVYDALDRGDRRWLVRNAKRFRRSPREARLLAMTFAAGLF